MVIGVVFYLVTQDKKNKMPNIASLRYTENVVYNKTCVVPEY